MRFSFIAYTSDRGGTYDIWLVNTHTGRHLMEKDRGPHESSGVPARDQ